MDYEKAYKEALERAKEWEKKYILTNTVSPDGTMAKEFKEIFPQLAESEDERIRKGLVKLLTDASKTFLIETTGIEKASYLAYLEKQKEQKPAELRNGRQIALMIENGRRSGVIEGLKRVVDNPEEYGLCKSAEWSDEEKDKLNSIERLIVNANAHGNSLIGDKEAIELQHFIRSIVKPITNIAEWSEEDIKKIRSEEYTKGFNDAAFGGKIKEWSVEDEDRIRQIERIAQDAGCTQKLQEEIHDWLKSFRNRPKSSDTWKPSEGQMKVLKIVAEKDGTCLMSLYNDLKKLM